MTIFEIVSHMCRGTTTMRDVKWLIFWWVAWSLLLTALAAVAITFLKLQPGDVGATLRAFLGLARAAL